MPEQPQSYKNHTRFDPPWHFFIVPMLLLNLIASIVAIVRHYPDHFHLFLWWTLMAIVAFVAVGVARGETLTVQNRVIRLEEQLRYAALLPPQQVAIAQSLTLPQMIALRFASDVELPTLLDRAVTQNLTAKQIKQAITTWRPDTLRA